MEQNQRRTETKSRKGLDKILDVPKCSVKFLDVPVHFIANSHYGTTMERKAR